jgi:hypothetical protein
LLPLTAYVVSHTDRRVYLFVTYDCIVSNAETHRVVQASASAQLRYTVLYQRLLVAFLDISLGREPWLLLRGALPALATPVYDRTTHGSDEDE